MPNPHFVKAHADATKIFAGTSPIVEVMKNGHRQFIYRDPIILGNPAKFRMIVTVTDDGDATGANRFVVAVRHPYRPNKSAKMQSNYIVMNNIRDAVGAAYIKRGFPSPFLRKNTRVVENFEDAVGQAVGDARFGGRIPVPGAYVPTYNQWGTDQYYDSRIALTGKPKMSLWDKFVGGVASVFGATGSGDEPKEDRTAIAYSVREPGYYRQERQLVRSAPTPRVWPQPPSHSMPAARPYAPDTASPMREPYAPRGVVMQRKHAPRPLYLTREGETIVAGNF